MHINDLLKPESIALGISAPASKEEAIRLLADFMEKGGNLSDKEQSSRMSSSARRAAPQASATALRHRTPRATA
mgnify:CR=1 FL=1